MTDNLKNSLPISLNLKSVNPLPENIQKYFQLCKDKLDLIPNVLKAYSHNTEKLNAFTNMYNEIMLAESGLTKLQREMIAVVVSSINKCFYCQVAHGASVRELSKNPELSEELVMNYNIANISNKDKAMLQFSDKMTSSSYKIQEEDRNLLRQHGFTDGDIWDIASVVGFFNMSNRIASATKMMPNHEYHSKGR
tara:strand:+ start:656 stop:1237 length:582 start_codon:yes stop_codon:yes gene_type:complete